MADSVEQVIWRHDERIGALEEWRGEHSKEHIRLMDRLDRIANRPSWGVAVALTALSSAVVGLIVRMAWGG